MQAFFFTLIALNLVNSINSQTVKFQHKWSSDAIYFIRLYDNGSERSRRAIGKNPVINYDSLYKIYSIFYTDRDGYRTLQRKFEEDGFDEKSGLMRLKDLLAPPFSNSYYFADDQIESKGYIAIYSYGRHIGEDYESSSYLFIEGLKPY